MLKLKYKEIVYHVFLSGMILINALLPASSVSASSEQESKSSSEQSSKPSIYQRALAEKAKQLVQVPGEDNWLCYDAPNGCPSPNLPISPYKSTGTIDTGYPHGFPGISTAKIACSPRPDCIAGKVVYFRAKVSYSWVSMPVYGSVHHEARLNVSSTGYLLASKSSEYVDCGTGTSGSCTLFFEGTMTLPWYPWSWDMRTVVQLKTSNDTIMSDQKANYEVYYSLLPNVFSGSVLNSGANKSTIPGVVESDNSISITGCSTQGTCGDPINTNTGVFSFTLADMSFPTSAGDLVFQRSYSSGTLENLGSLGVGWTHNHEARLIFPHEPGGMDDYILFQSVLGNRFLFKSEVNGSYSPGPGVLATLTKSSSAPITYTLTDSQQAIFLFDENGRLMLRKNAQGHQFDYDYDPQGRVTKIIADNDTRFIQITYEQTRTIVSNHAGQQVIYEYDSSGDLVAATDVLGQTWTYIYDAQHHLTHVKDPESTQILKTSYDSQGRAWRQYTNDANGDGQDDLLVTLIYNSTGTTTVTDALGNSQTHTYDLRGTLVNVENQQGGTTEKIYDPNFRPNTIIDPDFIDPSTVTDPNQRITILDWSDDGANIEYVKDGSGGETLIKYENINSPNSPTEVTDSFSNKTKYTYANPEFPTLPTKVEYFDASGVLISSTQYSYYLRFSGASAGKLEVVTDGGLNKTRYTYTAFGQVDTVTIAYETPNAQSTDYDYDDLGRLIKVTDPAGVITLNQYDPAGRLTLTIHNVDPGYAGVEDPPQNSVSEDDIFNLYTRYYYDVRGNQIAVVDTDWNITRTYYDLANRPVGIVHNLVMDSTRANDELDVEAAISTDLVDIHPFDPDHSDWNVISRTEYDDAGNVIISYDPQGVITRTYYDPANRRNLVIQNWAGTDLYGNIDTAPTYDPTDPDQNIRTETIFDANGNAIATIDTDGIVTRTYYDELNRAKTIVQNLVGHQIDYPFAPEVSIPPNPEHNVRTDLYYDLNGNQIATRDPKGVFTRTYYDALNRPSMVVQNWDGSNIYSDPAPIRSQCGTEVNVCSETFYDEAGNVRLTVDPSGIGTHTEYDEANRPTFVVQNWGGLPNEIRQTEITYDGNGRRETTTDILNRVTKYDYNHVGQLFLETKNYLPGNTTPNFNITTQYTYDALGRQRTREDVLGRVSKNDYDDLGRLKSVTQNYLSGYAPNYKDTSGNQYNNITKYAYDIQGNQIAQIEVKDATTNVVTRTYFDALRRSVAVIRNFTGNITSPLTGRSGTPDSLTNIRTDTVYLGNGSVDYMIDELGNITGYEYDDLGRVIGVIDPELKPTNFAYDASGNRVLLTTFSFANDPTSAVSTKYEYDKLNRLKSVIENYREDLWPYKDAETNVRTDYTYDAGGNRLSIQDGQSNLEDLEYTTMFTYDPLGRIKSERDPLGLETLYTYNYDTKGILVSIRDAMFKTTVHHYDELDRLYWIEYPDPDENIALAADVIYEYDILGRRTKMTDGLGETTWVYNNVDLPTDISAPLSPTVSYEYDWRGNRTSLEYAAKTFIYDYNVLDQLDNVEGSGLSAQVQYGYDASGRLRTVNRPNGVDTLYDYYNNGWLQNITHTSNAGTLATYQYQYYDNGNRKQAKENIQFPSPFPTATPTGVPTTVTPSESPSLTPTPGSTATATTTPTITFTPTITPTSPSNDLIFADGFESGNLSAWTSTSTDAGDLSVSTLAAIKGSQGMQALIDDTTAIFVTDDTPNAEPRYRMRFYFDPNSLTMANGDAHIIFRGIEGSSTIVLRVEFGFSSGVYQIRAGVVNDSSTWTDTNWVTISDTSHSIEMDWRAASAIGANDGGLTMWIDGTQQANLTGIDNDTRRVDRARLGALASIDAGTSGTSYFDAFESRRTSYIGPLAQVPSGKYAYASFVQPTQQADFSRLPLSFVANVGQFDKAVQFQTNSLGGSIYFTSSDVVLALIDKKMKQKSEEDDSLSLKDNSKVVRIQYKNARKDVLVQGLNLLPGVANFMLGTDKKAWVANAPTYDGIVYSDIYPGIDLTYQGAGNSLKSTFVVAPGMDPATIQWSYKDAGNISLAADGNLIITLPAKKAEQTDTTLIEHAPVAWQEPDGQRVDVAVQYAVSNKGDISFLFPEGYDASLPLTIDPTLTYSTYLGDIGTDVGTAITSDSTGNVYVTGYSWCGDFPLVDPIPQGSYVESEIIISKISADGSTLLYSTCVGGSGDEIGTSVALDTQGRIVVGGATDSADFPIVGGIATYGGNTGICTVDAPCQDSFILALNADGSAIRYSTYLGGDGREELGGIAVDANGKLLVIGSTTSTNFPTVNAYDNSFATGGTCSSSVPCYDITVTKIDPDFYGMSAFLYSTYLGANNRDMGYGLALDSSGRVYLTGLSQSDGYPTRNAMQATRKGDRDIVVTVIDPSLSADASLLYSTYLGSADFEAAYGIARDSNGNIYVTGRTQSSKFPLRDPLQYTSHAGSTCGGSVCSEAFVTKLNLSTNTIVYSTYLGGSQDDAGHGIALDSYGRAYVTGYTRSSDFPILNALQATKGADGCSVPPCADAFLSVLEPDGRAFAYSTFLGGNQNDFANGIARDANNNIYLVGETYSTNFPTTPGAYDVINTQTDKRDAFIAKVSALGTPAAQSYSHLDVQVSASSDDAEESASGSSLNLTSLDLELTQTSSNQKIGIRFANVEIPEGAIIQNAWIQFTSSAANAEVTNLTIQAQASDNAPTFVASANNISSRAKTTASVSWSPDVWNADEGGPNQRTPNLASVLQEVTNRPGWAPGNGLAIILTGTANSKRIAKAYDRDIFGAPYLHIEYTLEALPTPTFTPTLTQTGTATATAILTATDTPTVTSTTTATPIGTPTLTATFGPSPTPMPSGLTTILYEYDALNRLTRADHSGGDYYHYTYDSVGNRLTQDILLGDLPSHTTYVYDDANRLTSVDALTHTWYDNGNLRSDGLNTYTYDSANRLKSLTGPSISAVYEYNGLGDRLRQTLDGQTTTFTMDLNTGLTQALSDGTNTYIYGIDRIAQVNTATEYFLGDALGSVRQLTNQSGAITYTSAYDPYGVVTATGGSSQSSFGFTGEYSDSYIKLIYLRSRMYDPLTGRFQTKDSWQGDYSRPMSYNSWLYVYGNPINLTDPSGHDPWWCDSQPDPEACRDQYLPRVNARVYYLNAIGTTGIPFQPDPDPINEQGYIIFRVGQIVGQQNIKHIPIFIGNVNIMRIQMFLEMCEVRLWSPDVASAINDDLQHRPLSAGERLIIIGNSGGGTVAIETLDLLKQYDIFVNQVILRGSPVREFSLRNVGRVDYITAEFYGGVIPDHYYSFDNNPFDNVQVQEHSIDFEQQPPLHVPNATNTKKKIANLIVSLIRDGAK